MFPLLPMVCIYLTSIVRKIFAVLLVTTLHADILLAFTESITVFKLPLLVE